jgi:sugar fermentation stimulation protein A
LLAAVLFVIQRIDAVALAPNRSGDPAFAAGLERAVRAGVRVQAIRCRVTRDGVSLDRRVPVCLRPCRGAGSRSPRGRGGEIG